MIKVFTDNRFPVLTDFLKVGNDALNLSTASSIEFHMRPIDSDDELTLTGVATILAAGSGQVQFAWGVGDLAIADTYVAWWHINWLGGQEQDTTPFVLLNVDPLAITTRIDIDSVRQHVETGLDDLALALILDEAIQEVEGRFGNDEQLSTRLYGDGSPMLRLGRPAASITTVIERNYQQTLLGTLSATDYYLLHGGRSLVRTSSGPAPYPHWRDIVDVTYIPKPESLVRDRVTVDLVKLACEYSGLAAEWAGDWKAQSFDYRAEREKILSGVGTNRGFRFA